MDADKATKALKQAMRHIESNPSYAATHIRAALRFLEVSYGKDDRTKEELGS